MKLRKYLSPLECEEFCAEGQWLIELERDDNGDLPGIQILFTKETPVQELVLYLRQAANEMEAMNEV